MTDSMHAGSPEAVTADEGQHANYIGTIGVGSGPTDIDQPNILCFRVCSIGTSPQYPSSAACSALSSAALPAGSTTGAPTSHREEAAPSAEV